jgi:hypoxanthine phosphoribosyltransferase
MDVTELNKVKENATLLFTKEEVDAAVATLANQLAKDYASLQPVFLVVMTGGVIFAGKLLPELDFPAEIDYCHASRYAGETAGGDLVWRVTPQASLADRHVVIVDDILDEGATLQSIIQSCESVGAKSVKTAVLVEKMHDRKSVANFRPDYCELQAPDRYLFGCGMDYQHYWRNTEAIYYLND